MGRCGAVRNLTQRKAEYLEVTFRITKCIVWLNDMRVGGGGGHPPTKQHDIFIRTETVA